MKNIANIAKKIILLMISDKAFHFLWCFFLASIWLPLGIVFAVGKEFLDKWLGHKFSIGDIIADIAGIIIAYFIFRW